MTLLTIVQSACDRIGITRPTSVVGSSDQQVLALFGFAQQEGRELARRGAWQALTEEQLFTSTATQAQTGAVPSDLDRFIPETFYNRTRKRQVMGPLSPQEWQAQLAITATVVYDTFRQRGNDILMIPTPPAGDEYAYEYVSKNWCASPLGTAQAAWAADSDVALLDEELVTLGLVWRFRQAKGFDYAEAFRSYETQVAQALARDGSKRTLNFANQRLFDAPRYPGVVEGSWNV
jgi:hypothetical protein